MCGWNIHSSQPERQNFSTLLVSFKPEINLLSSRTIPFFLPPKYQENVQSLSYLSPSTFYTFYGGMTQANDANPKVTGAALFSHTPKTKPALSRGRKGCHSILIEFSLSFLFSIGAFSGYCIQSCNSWVSETFSSLNLTFYHFINSDWRWCDAV